MVSRQNFESFVWVAQMHEDDPSVEAWCAEVSGDENLQVWFVTNNKYEYTIIRVEDHREGAGFVGPEVPVRYNGPGTAPNPDDDRAFAILQSHLNGRLVPVKAGLGDDAHAFNAYLYDRTVVFDAAEAHKVFDYLREHPEFFPETPAFSSDVFTMIDGPEVAEEYEPMPELAEKGRFYDLGSQSGWQWVIHDLDAVRFEAEKHLELASDIADIIFDTYELMDQAEVWQRLGEKEAEAIEQTAIQLETPTGREFIASALKASFDDDAISQAELKGLVDRIQAIGPISGFPLGQTTTTHGFMVTDYVRAALDPHEVDLLGEAVRCVLANYGHRGALLDRQVEDALESRVGDISCFDSAGYVNFLRENDRRWKEPSSAEERLRDCENLALQDDLEDGYVTLDRETR